MLGRFKVAASLVFRLCDKTRAQDSSERGLPMLHALFVEFLNDPGSWLVDDKYFSAQAFLLPR